MRIPQQGGSGGLKGPQTAEEGAPIEIEVQGNDGGSIVVTTGGPDGKTTTVPVPRGGKVTIPGSFPAGTILYVSTNTPPFRAILIEIIPATE